MDQYFGTKELSEVVLRANTPMQFGSRMIEEGEPVLYFENISLSMLSEKSKPIFARGGWANMPRVIWEDRSELQFSIIEGVMSAVSMSILLSANVVASEKDEPLWVHRKEGPYTPTRLHLNDEDVVGVYIKDKPIEYPKKKTFIFKYARDVAQQKVYGKLIERPDPFDSNFKQHFVAIYEDKALSIPADINEEYVVDYYYEYGEEALVYTVQKERFNGLFTLEGKFYSKDENEGKNYVNLIYMPKVRVVSNINLRLGERADPTVSTFNIIGLPENSGGAKNNLIMEITRLGEAESDI